MPDDNSEMAWRVIMKLRASKPPSPIGALLVVANFQQWVIRNGFIRNKGLVKRCTTKLLSELERNYYFPTQEKYVPRIYQ